MESMSVPSQSEVEALKQKWLNNPTFDLGKVASLEVGERFAPFQEELRVFQEKTELAWAQVAAVKQHVLVSRVSTGDRSETTYQRVLAEEALQRYLHIVIPEVSDPVREDLVEIITTLVEAAVRFRLAEQ